MDINKLLMCFCVNTIRYATRFSLFKKSFTRERAITKKEIEKRLPEGGGKNLFIVLNGPSLKTQDLSILKGENLMFVNRGFMHPLYEELKPKYHVFVDPKMLTGVWKVEWIDEIFEKSPDITVILPIEWHSHPKFFKYKNDKRIFWQYWILPYYWLGVSGRCFSFAISQKYKNIFFTGFDANSLAYDMIKSSDSHFYGADPELSEMTSRQHISALFTTFLQLTDLCDFSSYCINNKINIYNLTNGGLLDMFVRRDFSNPFDANREIPIKEGILK